jgi:transposase
MPNQRLLMRQIREVLRHKHDLRLSERQISRALGIGKTAIGDAIRRARSFGLAWPLPDNLTDDMLERRLFPSVASAAAERRAVPDWRHIYTELGRPDVTLRLLWEEYRGAVPDGYGYSRFCDHYRDWLGRQKPTMRQTHLAGDKMFVDFAGRTMAIVIPVTGEVREAQVFVAVLGASSYTYAEAVWSQSVPEWIGAHVRAFVFIGGSVRLVVPDNLKSGIIRSCFFEPEVQRSYAEMLGHYQAAAVPARPYRPKDKAKAEVGVQVVQRWILARLRNQTFFSLDQLNAAIRSLLDDLNGRVMRHLGMSRRQLFEQIDRPVLRALPTTPYIYAEWKRCRVGIDYHVEIEKHLYSVPHSLLRQEVEARLTASTVEIFHRSKRVAAHVRTPGRGRPTTVADHMPSNHQRYADWSLERFQRDAAAIGPATAAMVAAILAAKPHPEQGFRAAIGIIGLVKRYDRIRVEAACLRGIDIGARSYSAIVSILKNKLDRAYAAPEPPLFHHENIRGSRYFH